MWKKTGVTLFLLLLNASIAFGQMTRERVNTGGPVEETFWAPNLIGMSTVQHIGPGNLNVNIMHNFGILTDEPVKDFLGFDDQANVRIGLDFGITDTWSVGVGRTTFDKVYDFRSKLTVLRQTKDNRIPVSLGIKGDIGIKTLEDGSDFSDRLNFFSSLMISRRFVDKISLQVTPMYAHFNTVRAGERNDHIAIGLGGEYRVSERFALIAEYYPVIGDRSINTQNAFGLGINIETGGHVFQLFIESTRWHTEQYIISRNDLNFFEGDFRFGFNINRLFWLGGKDR